MSQHSPFGGPSPVGPAGPFGTNPYGASPFSANPFSSTMSGGHPQPPHQRPQRPGSAPGKKLFVGVLVIVAVLGVAFLLIALTVDRSSTVADPGPQRSEAAPPPSLDPRPTPPADPIPPDEPTPVAEPPTDPVPTPEPEPTPEPPPEPKPTPEPEPVPTDGSVVEPIHDGSTYEGGQPADSGNYREPITDQAYGVGVLQNNYLYWQPATDVPCNARVVPITASDVQENYAGILLCAEQVYGPQLDAYFGPTTHPELYFYSGTVSTPCGTFDGYVGYFCAQWTADGQEEAAIYLNQPALAQGDPMWGVQVLLHEFGHGLQLRSQMLSAMSVWPEDDMTTLKRKESQAECLSGVLLGRISSTKMTTEGLAWFEQSFATGGDQPGYGTGQERWNWIWGGYHHGQAAACNTWRQQTI